MGKQKLIFIQQHQKQAKTYLFPYQEIVDFAEGKTDSFNWIGINTTPSEYPAERELVNLGSYIKYVQKFDLNTGQERTLDLSVKGKADAQKPLGAIVNVKDIDRDKLLELLKSGTHK